MSLITAYEVLRYSTAGKEYPTAQFCELIPQIEEEFARECLSQDLYDFMVSKLVEYPSDAVEFDTCYPYATDAVVIRNGCLFVSLIDDNATDPLDGTGEWEAFERFDHVGANELWAKYLRRILAVKVFSASRFHTTWKSGAGGVAISMGDNSGYRSAKKEELITLKEADIAIIETATKNMLVWLKTNAETKGLPLPPLCVDSGCQTRGKRVRRWSFSNNPPMAYEYY